MRKRLLLPLALLLIGCGTAAAADQEIPGILYTRPLESVIFRHQDHARKGSACVVCHTGLFEMEALHVQKNKDYNMESLYKGKYCGACHNGKKSFCRGHAVCALPPRIRRCGAAQRCAAV